jgi:magnesium transporter
MIRVHVLESGRLDSREGVAAVEDAGAAPHRWIEVVAPDLDELQALLSLGLHELALEDAMREGHPPKLEEFGDHLFIIAHTPVSDETGDTRKIAMFLSKNWVVSLLRAPLPQVDEVLARVRREPQRHVGTPAFLAHALLDHMTDGFEQHTQELRDRLEEIEGSIIEGPGKEILGSILESRRALRTLARVVRGQRDVCQALSRSGHASLPSKVQPYVRNVYDHILRVSDQTEAIREGLGAARDAYLSAMNNRLSEIMRVLTVIATIMMPLGLIAGIYGMNFQSMPGLNSPHGFWLTLAGMLLLSVCMLAWFRHKRWL